MSHSTSARNGSHQQSQPPQLPPQQHPPQFMQLSPNLPPNYHEAPPPPPQTHYPGGGNETNKRPYRKRRKDPSCDACRERKVKCDSVNFSTCSECLTRQIKCQFSKSSVRRISSIRQIKGLEGSIRQMRDQLLEFKNLADTLKIDLPPSLRSVGTSVDLPLIFEDDCEDSLSGSEKDKGPESPRQTASPLAGTSNIEFRVNPSDNMTYVNTPAGRVGSTRDIKIPSYNPLAYSTKTNAEALSPTGLPNVQKTMEEYGFKKPIYFPSKWRSSKTAGDLIDQGNMPQLPKWEAVKVWVKVFHEMYQHWVPVLVWPDFMERVYMLYGRLPGKSVQEKEQARRSLPLSWVGVFFSVICVGVRDNVVKGYSIKTSGFEYLEKAQKCITCLYDDGSIEGIQVCVLLSIFHYEHGHESLSRVWVRYGAELCEEFCLLGSPTDNDPELDPVLRNGRSLIVWALYAADRHFSLFSGGSIGLRDFDNSSLHHPSPFLLRGDYRMLREVEKQGPMTTEQQINYLKKAIPKSTTTGTLDTRDTTAHSERYGYSTALYWLEATQMYNASAHMFRFSSVVESATHASNVLAPASLDLLEKQAATIDNMWPQNGRMDQKGPLNHSYVPPVFYLEYQKLMFRRHNLTPRAPAHLRQRAVRDCHSTAQQIYQYLQRILIHLTPEELAAPVSKCAESPSGVPMGKRNWRENSMVVNFHHLHMVIVYATAYLISSGYHIRAIILLEFVKCLCSYHINRSKDGLRLLGFTRHWNRRLAAVGPSAIYHDEEALALMSLDMQSSGKLAWVWSVPHELQVFYDSLEKPTVFKAFKDNLQAEEVAQPENDIPQEKISQPPPAANPTLAPEDECWDDWDLLRQEILALGDLTPSNDTEEDSELVIKMIPEIASRLKKRVSVKMEGSSKKPRANEDRRMSIYSII